MDAMVIREIQEALRLLSFYDARLQPISIDGKYGPQTKRAVTIFQTLNDLEPTGIVDRDTWDELRDSASEYTKSTIPGLNVFPSPQFQLNLNDQHEIAFIVQAIINALAVTYNTVTPVQINGIYDDFTANEIKKIQQAHRIEATGIVDIKTWTILARLYNNRSDTTKR